MFEGEIKVIHRRIIVVKFQLLANKLINVPITFTRGFNHKVISCIKDKRNATSTLLPS